ncbi:MAG: type VI secretion protein IcmF/TssM N-terminal domain-containing protein [Thermoanaerobaculia bacterium]
MYEFLNLLQRLPRPVKYLGTIFLLLPLVYVVSHWLGVGKYWWVFVLGMLVIVLALALFNMAVRVREKRQARAFEGELRRDSEKAGASREEVRQALGDLAAKWSESVGQLKQAGLSVYSLPWYLLIGEPQSGKSTTLKNSGLEFPVGTEGLSGAGGTRNCDWWFANEAVILDTAGRFTFQEEAAPDQQEWGSFLKLLRRYRKYCPINGVIVVIPCTSLLEDSPEEQERKAANIRSKLLHVQRVLQIRFPVFIMVTKADRVLGFSEFFSKLDPVDQQQLVGWSTDEGPTKVWNPDTFDAVYDAIAVRLYKLRLKLLADEENPAQADKLYVFPEEFRALKAPLNAYFKTIFQQTRFDEPFAFRGFYVSSGVQQGRPIAQATRDLLEAPGGAAEGVIESLESIFKKSRAFFIRHFYEKKVFPEQGLITRTAAAEKQQRRTLWLVRGLGILVLLLFLGGMIPAYRSLRIVLNPIRKSVKEARSCVEKGCSIAESYRIALDLQRAREGALKRRFWFALFLRGPRNNELLTTLGAIQGKVYLSGVVQPLLADTEGRMAVLDWRSFAPQYPAFFAAFDSLLAWHAYSVPPPPDSQPLVTAKELKLSPFIDFSRKAKGVRGGDRSKEVDDWIAGLSASDETPNRNLEGALAGRGTAQVQVPDPARPIDKFEEFWTVRNLALWDYTLRDGLKQYADLYAQMTSVPRSEPSRYLADYVAVGKRFRDNYEKTTQHLATPRPGATGFPGAGPAQWKEFLRKSYQVILRWHPVVSKISEARRDQLASNLETDYGVLTQEKEQYRYLLEPPPATEAWSKPAAGLAAMLNDLTAFSDLSAFHASDDGKLREQLEPMTNWDEKKTKIDEWRKRQEESTKGIANKGKDLGAGSPDPAFKWPERSPRLEETTELALLARMFPIAQGFFGDYLGNQCPPANCWTPVFAKAMIPAASSIVSTGAAQRSVAGWEGVAASIRSLADTEVGYLKRYVDQMAGRSGGGGGGFAYPYTARDAGSWASFLRAISGWQPQGGGGGGGMAPDLTAQLSFADMQAFAQQNDKLGEAVEYYRARIERPRAQAAQERTAPELLAAADKFRGIVSGLSDQPLPAWRQLAANDGALLKDYKAFSGNPRLRGEAMAQRLKRDVEDHGAHLMREGIRPQFEPKERAAWEKLNACCMSKFPFVNELQLRQERASFASGEAYSRGGPAGAAVLNVNLPTIAMADIRGPLKDFGLLAAEFAIDPIVNGEAREFDFIGEERPVFSVARLWEALVYGTGAAEPEHPDGKPHNISVRLLDRPVAAGAVFLGDRVSDVRLFDSRTLIRPSTDVKSGRTPDPYVWRLGSADAPLEIRGKNEDARAPWTGSLNISGGPLKLFSYILHASEERRPEADRRVWNIRVELPDAERPGGRLQGVFELKLDDSLPAVIPP